MTDAVRTFTVDPDDDGIRLDRWFKRQLPETSFNTVSRWARTGQLRIDGKRATPGDRVEAGQSIRVPPAEAAAPEEVKFREDDTIQGLAMTLRDARPASEADRKSVV